MPSTGDGPRGSSEEERKIRLGANLSVYRSLGRGPYESVYTRIRLAHVRPAYTRIRLAHVSL